MGNRSYDREVTFQRATSAHDGLQKRPTGWPAIAAVPARMKPGIGRERFANAQNAAEAPAVYFVLYDPRLADLKAADRLVDPIVGRTFDIQSVRWDGRLTSEMEIAGIARGA